MRLAVYATDALRVLTRLEAHAARFPDFDTQLRRACPDWRNPGAIDDPLDALTDVMFRLSSDLRCLIGSMEEQGTRP